VLIFPAVVLIDISPAANFSVPDGAGARKFGVKEIVGVAGL
jgi:hypothetical protein